MHRFSITDDVAIHRIVLKPPQQSTHAAGQSKTEQDRAGQSRAGQGSGEKGKEESGPRPEKRVNDQGLVTA